MIPIQDLLNRLRWDEAFAKGRFVVAYYDRVEDKLIRVPLDRIQVGEDHFSFLAVDPDGYAHEVPFHRVREVYKDGELIWHRSR